MQKCASNFEDMSLSDLKLIGADTKTIVGMSTSPPNNACVMQGDFCFRTLPHGLSLHGGQITELQNIKSSFELPPGLSFNIIFDGTMNFVVSGHGYHIEVPNQAAICACIVANHPETITRHIRRGNKLHKLNLFAEKRWLEARAQGQNQSAELLTLFETSSMVQQWQPSAVIVKKAKRLLENLVKSVSISHTLLIESLTIEILTALIDELQQQAEQSSGVHTDRLPAFKVTQNLKQQIDGMLNHCSTLSAIAGELNVSVSTLQRRFKAAYGVTVIDYVRQRRLDIAKSAMIGQDMSLGQAAYLAGYKYPSNFVTAFKKQYSITPNEFKKSHGF